MSPVKAMLFDGPFFLKEFFKPLSFLQNNNGYPISGLGDF